MRKYKKILTTAQAERFVPFIVDASGFMHPITMDFVNRIADYVPGRTKPYNKLHLIRKKFIRDLNIMLVNCNCDIARFYLSSLSNNDPKGGSNTSTDL